jgi:hypothetical protein
MNQNYAFNSDLTADLDDYVIFADGGGMGEWVNG